MSDAPQHVGRHAAAAIANDLRHSSRCEEAQGPHLVWSAARSFHSQEKADKRLPMPVGWNESPLHAQASKFRRSAVRAGWHCFAPPQRVTSASPMPRPRNSSGMRRESMHVMTTSLQSQDAVTLGLCEHIED